MLFCSIVLEFGKKRDLASALKAFEVSKQNLSSPNMHAYRTIIDVCGICGDYLKSRTIYEVLQYLCLSSLSLINNESPGASYAVMTDICCFI